MKQPPHVSVLADEALALLAPLPGRVYVDGTLGAAGHTCRIADTGAHVIGLDRDPAAIAIAQERVGGRDNVKIVHATFSQCAQVVRELGHDKVDGLLLDLGLSSIQLDTAERGFSFMRDGPIDMRMDPSGGRSALDLIRESSPDDLANVLFRYGDERYSRRIAARIKADVREGTLSTTHDLAAAIEDEIPGKAKRYLRVHPATKTFQALRIAVNRELEELEMFLESFPEWLRPGGRCVIISFHSLEDRLVKNRFRDLAKVSSLPRDLAEQAGEPTDAICKVLTRKPVVPSAQEVTDNPRARSAKLRACERTDA